MRLKSAKIFNGNNSCSTTAKENKRYKISHVIFLYPINGNEVFKVIKELKDKNGGVDHISARIIKM